MFVTNRTIRFFSLLARVDCRIYSKIHRAKYFIRKDLIDIFDEERLILFFMSEKSIYFLYTTKQRLEFYSFFHSIFFHVQFCTILKEIRSLLIGYKLTGWNKYLPNHVWHVDGVGRCPFSITRHIGEPSEIRVLIGQPCALTRLQQPDLVYTLGQPHRLQEQDQRKLVRWIPKISQFIIILKFITIFFKLNIPSP